MTYRNCKDSSARRSRRGRIELARLLLPLPFAVMSLLALAQPFEERTANKLAIEFCSGCHGPGGNSLSPITPRLAAQKEAYLINEIRILGSGSRRDKGAHSFMLGTANLLDDETAKSLASYYARQMPAPGDAGDPDQIERGRLLFEKEGEGGALACTGCHGTHAEGDGAVPRLAGQHAFYVKHQLRAIQFELRQVRDAHGIVARLSVKDQRDIAAYLESL